MTAHENYIKPGQNKAWKVGKLEQLFRRSGLFRWPLARHERAIINVWPLNSWEQVRDNVFKQWDIIFQELGHIYVSEGS